SHLDQQRISGAALRSCPEWQHAFPSHRMRSQPVGGIYGRREKAQTSVWIRSHTRHPPPPIAAQPDGTTPNSIGIRFQVQTISPREGAIMRYLTSWAVHITVLSLSLLTVGASHADTIYTFTSNNYTVASPPYTTSERLVVTIHLAQPLPPNTT